jgi:hypothetical protein
MSATSAHGANTQHSGCSATHKRNHHSKTVVTSSQQNGCNFITAKRF